MFKAEVEKWLEYVCNLMPSTIRDECKAFVDQYEAIIATLIANQINPDKVCQSIKVCPKSANFDFEIQQEFAQKLNEIELKKLDVSF